MNRVRLAAALAVVLAAGLGQFAYCGEEGVVEIDNKVSREDRRVFGSFGFIPRDALYLQLKTRPKTDSELRSGETKVTFYPEPGKLVTRYEHLVWTAKTHTETSNIWTSVPWGDRVYVTVMGYMRWDSKNGGVARPTKPSPPPERPTWLSNSVDLLLEADSDYDGVIAEITDPQDAAQVQRAKTERSLRNDPAKSPLGAIVGVGTPGPLVLRRVMPPNQPQPEMIEVTILQECAADAQGRPLPQGLVRLSRAKDDSEVKTGFGGVVPQNVWAEVKDGDLRMKMTGVAPGTLLLKALYNHKGLKISYEDVVRVTVVSGELPVEISRPYHVFGPPYYPPVGSQPPGPDYQTQAVKAAGANPAPQAEPPPPPPPPPPDTPKPRPQLFRIWFTLDELLNSGIVAAAQVRMKLTFEYDRVYGTQTVTELFTIGTAYPAARGKHFLVETNRNSVVKPVLGVGTREPAGVQIVVWDGRLDLKDAPNAILGNDTHIGVVVEVLNAQGEVIKVSRPKDSTATLGRKLAVLANGQQEETTARKGQKVMLTGVLAEECGDLSQEYRVNFFVIYKLVDGLISGEGTVVQATKVEGGKFTAEWKGYNPGEYLVYGEGQLPRKVVFGNRPTPPDQAGDLARVIYPVNTPTIKVIDDGTRLYADVSVETLSKGATAFKNSAGKQEITTDYGPVSVWVDSRTRFLDPATGDNLRQLPERVVLLVRVLKEDGKGGTLAKDFDGVVQVGEYSADNPDGQRVFVGGPFDAPMPANGTVDVLLAKGEGRLYLWSVAPSSKKNIQADFHARLEGDPTRRDFPNLLSVWADQVGLARGNSKCDPSGTLQVPANKVVDWVDVEVRNAMQLGRDTKRQDVARVLERISSYREMDAGEVQRGKMYVTLSWTSERSLMNINPGAAGFRPKRNFRAYFEGRWFEPTLDPFVHSYFHESRHGFQNFLLSITDNDKDKDYLPKGVPEECANDFMPTFGYSLPDDAKRNMLDDAPDAKMVWEPPEGKPADATGRNIAASLEVTVTPSIIGVPTPTANCTLPKNEQYDLPMLAPPQIEAEIGGRFQPINNSTLDTLGCSVTTSYTLDGQRYLADPQTGKFAVKWQAAKIPGIPKIKMTYTYPCKKDPQSILELDAYHWTMEIEPALGPEE